MDKFTINFNYDPFRFEKIIEPNSKKTYLIDTILLLILSAFSLQLIDSALNSNFLFFTDGSLAIIARPIWSIVGLIFFLFSIFYDLCFLLAFFAIDNRLSNIIAGHGFLIDDRGFHLKNTFNRRIRKSYLWKSNYNLIAGFNNTGNYVIFELTKKEHENPEDDKLIFHDALQLKTLRKFNLDKELFTESLKDCKYIDYQE